jgi:hypothetical protein
MGLHQVRRAATNWAVLPTMEHTQERSFAMWTVKWKHSARRSGRRANRKAGVRSNPRMVQAQLVQPKAAEPSLNGQVSI